MKRRVVSIWVTGMIVASLTGCGTKTGTVERVPESSNAIVDVSNEITETEDTEADVEVKEEKITENEFVGAEDENIVLYAEVGSQDYCPLDEKNYESSADTVSAMEDIPLYNGGGYAVGYIKNGSSITLDETGTDIGWARFENPIPEAGYDYLYVLKDFVTDADEISLTAEDMKQRIVDRILNSSLNEEINYVVLDEKASDMEVYECNMMSVYTDELDLEYWLDEEFSRGIQMFDYQTLYVECEDGADGWITVRLYYKDKIDWNKTI
ncbi:MAG: hypothetical protein OSJ73_11125 [Lachnospiraceae bacterium]|nr:hypothetical protein [Lachnospiraceae bacterium]